MLLELYLTCSCNRRGCYFRDEDDSEGSDGGDDDDHDHDHDHDFGGREDSVNCSHGREQQSTQQQRSWQMYDSAVEVQIFQNYTVLH